MLTISETTMRGHSARLQFLTAIAAVAALAATLAVGCANMQELLGAIGQDGGSGNGHGGGGGTHPPPPPSCRASSAPGANINWQTSR